MTLSGLAAALALCLVLPLCSARPGEVYVKQQQAQSASASSSSEAASSEQIVKKGGCGCAGGCGCGGASLVASKSSSARSAASSASSSSSSYEARSVGGVGGGCTVLTEAQIKERYAQKSGEALDVYFKRIVSRSYSWTATTEAYVKTLSTVWKDFSTLDLWYDRKYISYSREFFSLYYTRLESESWETYYSRLIKRESWETDELFARRITIVRDCFPSLDLWTSEKWFDKYTRGLYALEFKRFAKESEVDFINRIIAKDTFFDLTDEIWAKRVFLIQEATISTCSLWYNEKYFSYFKNYYSFWYKVRANEAGNAWLLRTLSLLPGESLDLAIKRITYIKEVTSSCGFWKDEYFKTILQAKSLREDWLSLVQKTFFPSCGGSVTIQRSSSSKSSAASASSSSASSESTKVVKAC